MTRPTILAWLAESSYAMTQAAEKARERGLPGDEGATEYSRGYAAGLRVASEML